MPCEDKARKTKYLMEGVGSKKTTSLKFKIPTFDGRSRFE
jgi:hypothetical protein